MEKFEDSPELVNGNEWKTICADESRSYSSEQTRDRIDDESFQPKEAQH